MTVHLQQLKGKQSLNKVHEKGTIYQKKVT